MRLVVLSDTHLPKPDAWLDDLYERYLEPADHVLHLGDMVSLSVYHYLGRHPSFHAVMGNMDQWSLREEIPARRILDLDGLSVGMTHGFGGNPQDLERWVAQNFEDEAPQLVCYGHTHIFSWRERPGGFILNPGSARLPRRGGASLALVERGPDGVLSCERVNLS